MQRARLAEKVLPTVILFDWDNTLVDTWPLIHGGISAVFEKRGLIPWTLNMVKERCHESAREAFPKLFPDDWQAAMDDYYRYVHEHHLKDLALFPYAVELLQALSNHGVPMGIVSNKNKALLVEEITHIGLANYFSVVVGAADAFADKPSPDPLYLALRQLHMKATRDVWFVGDSPVDWAAARAAGVYEVRFGNECFSQQSPQKKVVTDTEAGTLMVRDLNTLYNVVFSGV